MPLSPAVTLPLWANISIFILAAIVVWSAGTRLTRYVDGIATKTGIGEAFLGMLLLGGITSLPEVANVVTSSVMSNPRLAINNLLGSAAINVLMLAVADAAIGRDAVTSVVAKPSTMMMATLCMLVLIIIAITIAAVDVPILGVGIGSIGITAISVGFFWLAAGYDKRAPWEIKEGQKRPPDEEREPSQAALSSLLIRTGIAGVVLFTAGYSLSVTGDAIATQAGIETGFVGFAFIGVATSTPELSTVVTAIKIRRYEMAFGQVLGTNFINLSLILLADVFFIGAPVLNELGLFEVISALIGATLIGVFMVGLLEHRDRTIGRMGYDSLAVIILFCGGLALLYLVQ